MSDPLTPYGNRPMVTPIVHAVNYEYRDFEVLRKITDGEIDGYTYHRDDNPTVRAVEKQIAALEGAEDCVVCTSGMAASKEDYDKLWFTRQATGTTLDAYSASLLERGLKTFPLRAERMAANAMAVAECLRKHPRISRLYYPGLAADPGQAVARRQMRNGFGGMMAFDVGQSPEDAKRFVSALRTIVHAVSLGATESLICIPYLTTMLYLPPERRTIFGVAQNTVRLSVGIEPVEQITDDLKQAMEAI